MALPRKRRRWLRGTSPAHGISVDEGTTTPVVLHFDVDALGDITFDTGNVEVSLDVDADVSVEVGELDESGAFVFNDAQFLDPSAAYASALAVDLNVAYDQRLDIQSTSDWEFVSSIGVCKSGELLGATSSSGGAVGTGSHSSWEPERRPRRSASTTTARRT